MSQLEISTPTIADPEYCNIVEAQKKDLKIVFQDMIDIIKEENRRNIVLFILQ